MSKVITGKEAIRKSREIINQKSTLVIAHAIIPEDGTFINLYKFLDRYYLAVTTTPVHLSFFEEITKEEADNIVYNIRGLSRIGTLFEFGGFLIMKKIKITFKDMTTLTFTYEHEFDLHEISKEMPLCFNNMWINMDEVRFIEVEDYEK